ncbi:hypothetical protein [Thalassospira alkalitolerans]|uniref:hypothetical protein n=1 Tax=Thalassospira alkalitolerans TaxID=1293890 RepID=UPI003AA87E31
MLRAWRKAITRGCIIAPCLALVWLAACGSSDDIYEITKDEKLGSIKRTVEIELVEKVDTKRLKVIAESIHKEGFERTFIGYRIKGENRPTYWATTHYNPTLEVRIISPSFPDSEAMETGSPQGKVLGEWLVQYGFEYVVTFVEVDGVISIHSKFADGSSSNDTAIVEVFHGQKRFYTDSGKKHGEYFVIAKSGDLEMWSSNGNYYTARRQ